MCVQYVWTQSKCIPLQCSHTCLQVHPYKYAHAQYSKDGRWLPCLLPHLKHFFWLKLKLKAISHPKQYILELHPIKSFWLLLLNKYTLPWDTSFCTYIYYLTVILMYLWDNKSRYQQSFPHIQVIGILTLILFLFLHAGLFCFTLDETEWGLHFPYFHPFLSGN